MPRSLHAVQIGSDDSVFQFHGTTDTLTRQIEYAAELRRGFPGSRITNLVLTENPRARQFQSGLAIFTPIHATGIRRVPAMWSALQSCQNEHPIGVIATQTVFEDGWTALAFGDRYDIPVVGQVHFDIFSPDAVDVELGGGIRGTIRSKIATQALKRFHSIRVVSSYLKRELQQRYPRANIQPIPVPITMKSMPQDVSNRQSCVLFVGRLVEAKNLKLWLQIASRIAAADAAVTFHIVGDGPLRSELEQYARTLHIGSRTRFYGHVDYEYLCELYKCAKVFLMTSLFEGFGRVAAEAYLHFLPVVSTRVSGVEDIVEHGRTGFLRDSSQAEQIADDVLGLLRQPALRTKMAAEGNALVRSRFDPQVLRKAWIGMLTEAAR